MKKFSALCICAFMILVLNGCTKQSLMNLSVFIESYNLVSDSKISFTDFICESKDGREEYSFMPSKEGEILLKLISQGGEIEECRVTMSNYNSKLQKTSAVESDYALFKKTAQNAAVAFTGIDEERLARLFDELLINKETSEAVKDRGNYKFIYIISELSSVFIIRNNSLIEPETTEKPENKRSFSDIGNIRTETVPHR